MHVQRLAGQRKVRLADGLGLGRVRVNELGDVPWHCFPVVNQLRFGDQLANARPDEVNAQYRAAAEG